MNKILIIILTAVFAMCASPLASGQVVTQMGKENLKVPRGIKSDKGQVELDPSVTIDTETPYFQLIDSAQVFINSHEWPQAESLLRQAVATDPTNPNNSLILSNIATLQRYQGRLNDAAKNYSMALDLTPNATTLLLNRAALMVEMDSMDQAQADFKRVCDLDITNTEARYSLGLMALEQNNDKTAEDYFNQIKRINPSSGLYCEGMAMLHKKQGHYLRAAELLSQVIKAQPTAQLLGNRADCYLMLKQLNNAEEDIRNGLAINPDDPYLYILKAKLNKMRFAYDDMNADLERAIKLGVPRDVAKSLLNNSEKD